MNSNALHYKWLLFFFSFFLLLTPYEFLESEHHCYVCFYERFDSILLSQIAS